MTEPEKPNNKQFEDLTGQKFGRLTVVSYAGFKVRHCWLCECNCGNKIVTRGNSLKTGNTESCGCIGKERIIECSRTHGMAHTAEYHIWLGIKKRCYNRNSQYYKDYGDRGIIVCDKWLESFLNFYEDMGERPSKLHSIERINNNGNYCSENCKWAIATEQANNKRNNRYITYQNRKMTVPQWSRELNVNPTSMYAKVYKGLSDDNIIEFFLNKKDNNENLESD